MPSEPLESCLAFLPSYILMQVGTRIVHFYMTKQNDYDLLIVLYFLGLYIPFNSSRS